MTRRLTPAEHAQAVADLIKTVTFFAECSRKGALSTEVARCLRVICSDRADLLVILSPRENGLPRPRGVTIDLEQWAGYIGMTIAQWEEITDRISEIGGGE